MESNQGLTTSFILSLIGGVIIFVTSLVGLAWFGTSGPGWGGFGGWMNGMMGGSHGFTGGGQFGFFSILSILGLFSGVIMIFGAVMLRARPQDHLIWGVVVLVFALVSFVDMGGFFVGAILGIIGGALALSYHPHVAGPPPSNLPQ
jgi:hypothetical protein